LKKIHISSSNYYLIVHAPQTVICVNVHLKTKTKTKKKKKKKKKEEEEEEDKNNPKFFSIRHKCPYKFEKKN
jgi:hypothetical protein